LEKPQEQVPCIDLPLICVDHRRLLTHNAKD
jgi:hypothetical protein